MNTIVAISTAPGVGGIGMIRMSGEDSFNILDKIFVPKTNQNISEIKIRVLLKILSFLYFKISLS